jgi:hydroxymethylpyrimidine/phosphomethylpyrimidine kinase
LPYESHYLTAMTQPSALLTIAGSDSGGAAGLQADLKTWAALGVYGMSAVTAVTAQNSERVAAVHYLPPEFVAAQIDAVLSDYGAAAIKTGFIGRVETIVSIAGRLAHWREVLQPRPFIVIDPVLVNHHREPMFPPEVAIAYRDLLFPLADLVTPNEAEAVLLSMTIDRSPPLAEDWARLGVVRVLLKGLKSGDQIVDVFWDGRDAVRFPQPVIGTINLHGSGDTLSAAICAMLADGHDWPEAIRRAQRFTHEAIARGASWKMGAGHGPLGHGV